MSLVRPFKDLLTNIYLWIAALAFFCAFQGMEALAARANSLPFLLVFAIPFLTLIVFVAMSVLLVTRAAAQATQTGMPFLGALWTVVSTYVKVGLVALPFSLVVLWLQFRTLGIAAGWSSTAVLLLKEALSFVFYVLATISTGIALAQGSSRGVLSATFRFVQARGVVTPLIFGFLLLLFQLLPSLADYDSLRQSPKLGRMLAVMWLTFQLGIVTASVGYFAGSFAAGLRSASRNGG